ncbi:Uncharacterised protein [BD1-7 clade bacterium]|nr:Uncharacterised protein [BD1-7 clade bacterium]
MQQALLWLIDHKARAWICLAIIYVSLVFSIWWLWGVLLLIWGIQDLATETAWLAEIITKKDNPILYYLVTVSWLVMGFYLLFDRFL